MLLTTTAVGAVTGAAGTTGGLTGIISIAGKLAPIFEKLVSGEIFSKTIGQIKDGFDCWGSTWTPTRAKNELPEWMEELANSMEMATQVPDNELASSVNRFFAETMWDERLTSASLEGWIGWRYDTAKDCTLRGLQQLEKGIDAYIIEMANTLKAALIDLGYDAKYTQRTVTLYRYEDGRKPYQKKVPYFTIDKPLFGGTGTMSKSSVGIGIVLLIVAVLFGMKSNSK